jgi:hypothetical protein
MSGDHTKYHGTAEVVKDGGEERINEKLEAEGKLEFYAPKEYVCAIHGDIGVATIVSHMKGNEAVLCLRCYIEKLIELGVSEVKEKNT